MGEGNEGRLENKSSYISGGREEEKRQRSNKIQIDEDDEGWK